MSQIWREYSDIYSETMFYTTTAELAKSANYRPDHVFCNGQAAFRPILQMYLAVNIMWIYFMFVKTAIR